MEGGGRYDFAAPLPDAHPRLAGTLLLRPLQWVHGTLKQNENYADKLRLKTRCVTVDYAGDFHLDVVPRAPLVDEEAWTRVC